MPKITRAELLASAKAFCDSFAQKKSLDEILSHFSSSSSSSSSPSSTTSDGGGENESEILVHEHGLPQLAPFLGRDFRGVKGAREYFETVGEYLSYEDMRFVEFVADEEEGKVAVRGKARFTWTETGQSWDETFVYVLRFDALGKLMRYEVWADSGAAYLARRGRLEGGGKEG